MYWDGRPRAGECAAPGEVMGTAGHRPGSRPARAGAPAGTRRLWQVPLFLLGIVAVIVVVVLHLSRGPSHDDLAKADGTEAFEALAANDLVRAITTAHRGLERASQPSRLSADLHLVLGTAYLMQADSAPETERLELYRRARWNLQQALEQGPSEEHRPRLHFRLTKAIARTGADPLQVIPLAQDAVEHSPLDRADAYRLLIELYLALPVPNVEAALRVNENLLGMRDLSDQGDPCDLDAARVQRGELLLWLKRPEESRLALAPVPSTSSHYPMVRHLTARAYFQEEQWQAAAELWNKLLETGQAPHRGEALYALGQCQSRLGFYEEAARSWETVCQDLPNGDEALAAAFRLADLRASWRQDEQALTYYTAALQAFDLEHPNPHVDLATARRWAEQGIERWFEAGKFERATQLAERYRRIAAPGVADQHLARAAEAEAANLIQLAQQAAGPDGERIGKYARQRFHEAGDRYESLARARAREDDHADLLWRAAGCFLKAQEYTQATEVLKEYLALDLPDSRRADALLALGEAHRGLNLTDSAADLLKQALDQLAQPGPVQTRARYLLALCQIEQGQYDEAEANLREVTAMGFDWPEPAEFHQARFELGRLHYRRGQFAEAAVQLKKAIEQAPHDPQVLPARLLLAESCHHAALQETRQVSAVKTPVLQRALLETQRKGLREAAERYHRFASDLTDLAAARDLSDEEERLLRTARLGYSQCLFDLGRYEEAVGSYEAFLRSYPEAPESLTALMQIVLAHWRLKQTVQARQAVARAKAALEQWDEKDVLAVTRMSRRDWQSWLDWAEGQMTSPR